MLDTTKLCPACMNDNGGEKICPVCGYDMTAKNPTYALPIGFKFEGRYIVGAIKSKNGEGITYIGWDNAEASAVNIREYFPDGFAVRNPDKTVSMVKGGEYIFNEGLMEFLEINRTIMKSESPSHIPVIAVFEDNGTVYSVTRNIPHITMSEFLVKNGGNLKWEQARPLFLPLIDTIKAMNDVGIIHGGISTDTILVGRDGKLRISGYAVSKLRNTDSELKEELFSGFAATEQYNSRNKSIGAHTDVYGLCATLFNVLIGVAPANAQDRLQNDSMTIPAHFAEELPRHVLSALANGLQVDSKNRTENIEEFKNELVYAETSHKIIANPVKENDSKSVVKEKNGSSMKYLIISAVTTAVVFILIATVLIFTVFKDDIFKKETPETPNQDMTSDAPVVDVIGSVDENHETEPLYKVPSVTGRYYAELVGEQYEKFVFVIKAKEFSDKYEKGKIISQSVAAGTELAEESKVEVVISLGPQEIQIASVLGSTELEAKIELLKQGFLYENIEVLEKYDANKAPGTVLEQEPKYGTQVNTETAIKIYVNSYKGDN